MTWEFKLEPTAEQISEIERILDLCRNVWNLALRERKDWLNSRKSAVNACSLHAKEMLGKYTLDAGLGQFVNQILPWVCWKRDVFYGKVDARGTSQECPDCGAEVRKDLSTRISWCAYARAVRRRGVAPLHHCHNCGSIKPRDVASGQVICTRGQRGIENACGVEAAGTEIAQSSWLAVKQEIFGATQGISRHTR